jgi:hypothetical protein
MTRSIELSGKSAMTCAAWPTRMRSRSCGRDRPAGLFCLAWLPVLRLRLHVGLQPPTAA